MIDPEKYETNKSVAARDAAELVPQLLKFMGPWRKNEKVLDYGCGAGSTGYKLILPHVEQHDSTMYSVDISDKMLNFAKEHYSHPKIIYAQGDILNAFTFEDIQFDKIFSVYVFHFVSSFRKALSGLYKCLKPGGRLACTFVWTSFYLRGIKVLGESEKWKKYMDGYKHYLPEWTNHNEEGQEYETCKEMFQEAGYKIVHLEVTNRSFPFDDINILLELYMSLNPKLESIPESLHSEFKEDLRKIITGYAGIPVDSKGILSEYLCVVAVVEKPS